MKRIINVLLVAVCIAMAMPAQAQLKWGVKGGLNVSKVTFDSDLLKSDNMAGFFIGPMGFTIDDKKLKRAGLDYWGQLDITYYQDLDAFFAANHGPFFYFTSKGPQRHTDAHYPDGSYLVFGREDAGLPEELLAANQQQCVRMPMRKGERCLNLSNAVAVGVYEVLRQWDFADLETHGQLTRFEWK